MGEGRLRVGVLFGGRSAEHEVSLWSARSVIEALDTDRYEVVPIGITREGRWLVGGDPMAALEQGDEGLAGYGMLAPDPSIGGILRVEGEPGALRVVEVIKLDVVFPVLHGPYGEDGTVQGVLDLAGIPYVGAGVLGSALGMDKAVFKSVMRAHGLPQVSYRVVLAREWEADRAGVVRDVEERLGYPVFTKPANLGSSVGVRKCGDREALVEGVEHALRYDRKVLVEEAVPAAREIEVSVLGNDEPEASVAGEIVPSREFYSYEAKYLDEGDQASQLLIPARVDEALMEEIRSLAVRVYRAIDCAGMARVDFLLSGETGKVYVNEVNTIPGFTSISMYAKLWEASGIPYGELIDRLIELALKRHAERSQLSLWPDVEG